MKLFTKKPAKKPSSSDDYFDQDVSPRSASSSPTKSPTKSSSSPTKKSSRSTTPPGASSSSSSPRETKSRSSRPFGRHSTDPGSSRRNKIDPDTHPLNLPPEERKRLSALSAMSRPEPMDVDRESTGAGAAPSSPSAPAAAASNSAAPQPAPQTSFSVPIPNGISINTAVNGEDAPMPPPHKSNPSSPVPTTEDEAEAYKAAGNKFFKDKDFKNAIVQYSKGMPD